MGGVRSTNSRTKPACFHLVAVLRGSAFFDMRRVFDLQSEGILIPSTANRANEPPTRMCRLVMVPKQDDLIFDVQTTRNDDASFTGVIEASNQCRSVLPRVSSL